MFLHAHTLLNPIADDEPDPFAANALQEGLGGQYGEMRTMVQYLYQSFNFRGDGKQYRDLIQGIAIEEISHVEHTSSHAMKPMKWLSLKHWILWECNGTSYCPYQNLIRRITQK